MQLQQLLNCAPAHPFQSGEQCLRPSHTIVITVPPSKIDKPLLPVEDLIALEGEEDTNFLLDCVLFNVESSSMESDTFYRRYDYVTIRKPNKTHHMIYPGSLRKRGEFVIVDIELYPCTTTLDQRNGSKNGNASLGESTNERQSRNYEWRVKEVKLRSMLE